MTWWSTSLNSIIGARTIPNASHNNLFYGDPNALYEWGGGELDQRLRRPRFPTAHGAKPTI